MIFPIDRLQFTDDKLIAFEFFNIDTEQCNEAFMSRKVQELKKLVGHGLDEFYYIKYRDDLSKFWIEINNQVIEYNYQMFRQWFLKMNDSANSENSSKQLGKERESNIDNFSAKILNNLYKPIYNGVDFSVDDNGLELVKRMLDLSNSPTFGFDADLFCTTGGYIIELLKNESDYVTNLTSHPSKYTGNKQKFISLWNASTRFSNRLLCVNYSENTEEALCLMVIVAFDTDIKNDRMNLLEFAYQIESHDDLLDFLKSLDNGRDSANDFISMRKKELRNRAFFKKVYDEKFKKNDIQNRWNTAHIGKNFK